MIDGPAACASSAAVVGRCEIVTGARWRDILPVRFVPLRADRRQAAVRDKEQDHNTLTDQEIPPLDSWFVMEFKRPGIQNGVFRKLKQGRYEAEAILDMHSMSVAIARREVFEFLEESHRLGLRSLLLIHGKGESKPEKERSSILKAYVNHWLRELETVQAFHSAQNRHGGTGAVYVLLRKSEEKKRENREKLSRGRVPYDPQT
jgi:DNA-nicking Smr family endonuclease